MQRTFEEGLHVPPGDRGADLCRAVVEHNAEDGVTWISSFVSEDQDRSPYEAALALAESDDPLAVRRAIEELGRLGARPASAIVARRLRERGVRGVPRGPRPQTRETRPA